MNLEQEILRTRPDYVVYVPRSAGGSFHDTGNEHFLVFDGPDGSLMAVWTQSSFEAHSDHRIVFSASRDEGVNWTEPRTIAGPQPSGAGRKSSWGFPLVSHSGRIYVLYNRDPGIATYTSHTTGWFYGVYSDDAGQSWSQEQRVPMHRGKWDHPDPTIPPNVIVWQKPERIAQGKYFVGLTRWVSSAVRQPMPVKHWTAQESVTEFMRFENVDDDPEPSGLQISWLATNDDALQVGFPGHPDVSVLQEPSVVALPDERLFAVMRSPRGNPYYSVSGNNGETWSAPEVLRYRDGGAPLLHPCSPCPIYPLTDDTFLFLHHNHDGHFEQWGPFDTRFHRRPLYSSTGTFQPDAQQPIWFDEPQFLMDNDGVALGLGQSRADLAMYSSFTHRNGQRVLWYPDRKFFLLGKNISGA